MQKDLGLDSFAINLSTKCGTSNVNQGTGGGGGTGGKEPVHSSISEQEIPVPEKPVLHTHVKAPSMSVHAALVSQLWVPSAIEGRGPSPLLLRPSVSGPWSIRV